jgi:hypothetical protein
MLICFLRVCILDFKVALMATCHLQLEFILYKILVSSPGLSHVVTNTVITLYIIDLEKYLFQKLIKGLAFTLYKTYEPSKLAL